MKIRSFSITLITVLLLMSSCKMFGRAAAKYWTKKQIKEFVENCETNASKVVGEDKAKQYCDCAVDVVAEKYQNYDQAKKATIRDILKIAKDCK